MWWFILIMIFLAVIFYLYKTSKNDFFFQSKEDLDYCKSILIQQLKNYARSEKDIERTLISYDWFCKNPQRYDGSTIVRDLYDIKYNGNRLSSSSMNHDYDYIINKGSKNIFKNWKSNYQYVFVDLIKNGKGLHLERFIGLTIVSIPFVIYNNLKK